MEGEGGDFLEIFSSGAAGGLDGEAVEEGGEVAGEVGGIGAGGEIFFFFGAGEALAESGDEGLALLDELLAHAVGVVAAGEGGVDGEAAGGIFGVGEMLDGALEEFFGDGAGGGLVEGGLDVGGWASVVAVEDFFEEGLLVAEGGVEGGSIDAHGFGEVGEGGAFVAFLPEDIQRGVEGLVGVE